MNETAVPEAAGGTAVLRARGLRKHYGKDAGLVRAVDGVDLDVDAGETVAVTGPSGCGKSTLLHLLGGLDRASAGELWLAGRRVDRLGERALARLRREAVGFVFQAFHLMDELTAVENVELPGLLAGQSPRAARRRAAGLLERVGLADRAGFLPSALSGGQRQRVAIARALVADPLVVLADEPTGNLDSEATLEVLRLFDSLHAAGQTLVIVTHDSRIAATADRLISMRDGAFVDQTRRTGLLKAAGGGPGLVAGVLLAENLVLALAAAAAGLLAGWLAAPLITSPGAALVGTPGAPSLTVPIAAEVVAVAVTVALAATLVPAVRAARTSTVSALAGVARPPRRRAALIAVSRRLPVPLLLGLRLVARRTRRAILGAASIMITAAGVVAVLAFHVTADRGGRATASGLSDPVVIRDEQTLLVLTVVLLALTALNAVCAAWTTVLDTRAASALARALGATPRQVGAGIAAAQVIPAVPGALLGIPLGIGLYAAAGRAGRVVVPPAWWLAVAVLGVLIAVAALASIPAWAGTRRPAAEILQAEAV